MDAIKEILHIYRDCGAEAALTSLMEQTVRSYGGGYVTVLVGDRIYSTIKNQDSREEVQDNYLCWRQDTGQDIRNRISGLWTTYLPLGTATHGGRTYTSVLITELPTDRFSEELRIFYSMLASLFVFSGNEAAVDGITRIPCADSLLSDLQERNVASVCMLRFPQVTEADCTDGWEAGTTVLRECVRKLDEMEPYFISRDTIALLIDGDITIGYDRAFSIYSSMTPQPEILLAEVQDTKQWDKLGEMTEEVRGVHGVCILYQHDKPAEGQVTLFSLMGMEEPAYTEIRQAAGPEQQSTENQ